MAVYFLRAGEDGPVKIGTAIDVAARIAEFQTGHYETLSLLRELDGGYAEEKRLHRHYAERRLRGEWFTFCPTMLTIDVADIPEPPAPVEKERSALDRFLDALGGNTELARLFGIKPNAVGMWRERGVAWPYRWAIARLAKEKGVPLPNGFLEPRRKVA